MVSSSRKISALVFISLVLLALILAGRDLFHPELLFFKAVRDPNPWLVSFPWREFIRRSFAQNEFPLWNPYNGLGAPFIANWQSAVFSPLRWPFYFLPFKAVVVPLIVLELAFAGFGAWLLARRLNLSDRSAFLCGAGFMLSGYLVQYLNNQHLVIDLLLPYGLLACERLIARPVLGNLLLLVLVLVLVLLGGQPGAALFSCGFISAYLIFKAVARGTYAAIPGLALALCLALLISMLQLLPFLEAIPQSWTYHPPGYAFQHLALKTAASIFSPVFLGPVSSYTVPVQQVMPWLGEAVCLLALVSIFRMRKLGRESWFFLVAGVCGLGVVYGLPGFSLVARVPGLSRLSWFKYPQPIITLCFVMLAGMGLESLRGWRRGGKILGWSLIFLAAGLPLFWHHLLDRPSFYENMTEVKLEKFSRLGEENLLTRFAADPKVWMPEQALLVPLFDLGVNDALIPRRFVRLVRVLNHYRSEEELMRDFFAFHSLRLRETAFTQKLSRILNASLFLTKSEAKAIAPGFWIRGDEGLKSKSSHTALFGDPFFAQPINDSLPRLFFPQKLTISRDQEDSFEKLLKLSDLSREAVVQGWDGPLRGEGFSRPEFWEFGVGMNGLVFSYRAESSGFAVLSEQYFPGWKSFLDGEEMRIYPADYLLRGVLLPAGVHKLKMVYQPWGFRLGLYASLASLVWFLFFISGWGFSAARPGPGR